MRNIELIKKTCIFAFIVIWPGVLFADVSLGDIADTLMVPTAMITKLIDVTCYIIGITFILVSMAQYKIHRQSPKLVPLTTPITLVILGVIALLIPYVTTLTETGKSEHEKKETKETLLPMPDMKKEKSSLLPLPMPKSNTEPSSSSPDRSGSRPYQNSNDSSGGASHWTQDPNLRH